MQQKIFEKFITKMYPKLDIKIINYRTLERKKLNENGEWVLDKDCISVDIKNYDDNINIFTIEKSVKDFTGYNIIINLM